MRLVNLTIFIIVDIFKHFHASFITSLIAHILLVSHPGVGLPFDLHFFVVLVALIVVITTIHIIHEIDLH